MEPAAVSVFDGVTTAMTTGFGDVVTQGLSAIGSILPVVLPIAGAFVLVGICYRVFKRFSH